jgi:hypothetical protein
MKTTCKFFIIMATVLSFITPATATLINIDISEGVSGFQMAADDQLIWADLNNTYSMTHEEQADWSTANDFRFATLDEIDDLLNYILEDAEFSSAESEVIGGHEKTSLNNTTVWYAYGRTDDGHRQIDGKSSVTMTGIKKKFMESWKTSYSLPTGIRSDRVGAWLVSEVAAESSEAPEPTTFALLAAGLVGLAAVSRRRSK